MGDNMVNCILESICCLKNPCLNKAESVAFDGSNFYVTSYADFTIYKLDSYGDVIEVANLHRYFNSICYDDSENCFWAVSPGSSHIYKFNEHFENMSILKWGSAKRDIISSISYCAIENYLLLFTQNDVIKLSKTGEILNSFHHLSNHLTFCGCATDRHTILSYYIANSGVSVINIKDLNFVSLNMTCLPEHFCVKTICPAYDSHDDTILFILANKGLFEPYLFRYRLVDGSVYSRENEADSDSDQSQVNHKNEENDPPPQKPD